MKRIFHNFIFGLFFIFLALVFISYDTYAKKDEAPGQLKKQEVSQNTDNPGSEQKNKDKNPQSSSGGSSNQGGKKEEKTSSTDKNKNIEPTTEKEKGQKKSEGDKPKIGSLKLKDILSALSTGSSDLKKDKKLKIEKLKVSETTPSAQLKRHAIQGLITGLADGVITLVHQIHRDRVYQVFVNEDTVIKIKGIENASFSDLAVGQRIAAVGEPVGNSTESGLLAKRIHVIPGLATGIFKKQPLATPSGEITPTTIATVSATPTLSATPTSTPSATPSPTP